jgi:hypothetical protein
VPCKSAASAALVQFTTAFNAGSTRTLDGLVAKSPEFSRFYVSGETGARSGDESNRATLLPYFLERHAQNEQLALVSAEVKSSAKGTAAHFSAVYVRTADDLVGGPKYYDAKGAFWCIGSRASLYAWAMGVKSSSK